MKIRGVKGDDEIREDEEVEGRVVEMVGSWGVFSFLDVDIDVAFKVLGLFSLVVGRHQVLDRERMHPINWKDRKRSEREMNEEVECEIRKKEEMKMAISNLVRDP